MNQLQTLPHICVSVGRGRPGAVLAQLAGLDFAEIRIDLIDFDDPSQSRRWLAKLFAPERLTIATCRPGNTSEALRRELILAAIGCGAHLADVELEAPAPFQRQIGAALHDRGGKLILSHHSFDHTPSVRALRHLASDGFERGADLVKIACAVENGQQARQLLSLLDMSAWRGRILLCGLGHLGSFLRGLSLFRGAPFTYAAPDVGPKVIGDQPRAADLRQAVATLARFQRCR